MSHFIARAWQFRWYLLGNPTHMWNRARRLVALKERDMTTLAWRRRKWRQRNGVSEITETDCHEDEEPEIGGVRDSGIFVILREVKELKGECG
jgi:hypothetical protein